MIGTLVRTVLSGLVVAGIVHVVAVLLVPGAAPGDAVARVAGTAPPDRVTVIPADTSVLAGLDPFFVHAVCPFDVSRGPVEIAGQMPPDVWTIAVAAGTGGIAGSLEHGSVADGRLDLVVGRPGDVERMRLQRVESGRTATMVEVDSDRGFVLLRAFDGPRADEADIRALLSALTCGPAA